MVPRNKFRQFRCNLITDRLIFGSFLRREEAVPYYVFHVRFLLGLGTSKAVIGRTVEAFTTT
jgi:hypothetical protein